MTGAAAAWANVRGAARGGGDAVGLLLMVTSAAAFALMAAMAKLLLPDTPTQAVVLSRGIVLSTLFLALARARRIPILGTGAKLRALVLRGLFGYGALSCYFWSVQRLPLGDAVLLQYSNPMFVAMLAPFVLREPTSRLHWPLVLGALCGVGLIVGPSGQLGAGALIGLCGSFLSGLAYMTVRDLARTEHALTIMLWFPLVTIPGSLVGSIAAGPASWPRGLDDVLGHLAVIASALVGQWSLTRGLARTAAARATAVTMTGPVFGLCYGWLFFATVPTAASLCGTALVMVSLALLAMTR
jgi:drug/metabolite transporter (DMT)-like permease